VDELLFVVALLLFVVEGLLAGGGAGCPPANKK